VHITNRDKTGFVIENHDIGALGSLPGTNTKPTIEIRAHEATWNDDFEKYSVAINGYGVWSSSWYLDGAGAFTYAGIFSTTENRASQVPGSSENRQFYDNNTVLLRHANGHFYWDTFEPSGSFNTQGLAALAQADGGRTTRMRDINC
jgi:hypothetical protein